MAPCFPGEEGDYASTPAPCSGLKQGPSQAPEPMPGDSEEVAFPHGTLCFCQIAPLETVLEAALGSMLIGIRVLKMCRPPLLPDGPGPGCGVTSHVVQCVLWA